MPGTRRPVRFAHPARRRVAVAMRLAAGWRVEEAATITRCAPGEAEALLARPGFAGLVEACRRMHALPHEERLRRLVVAATQLLLEAVEAGDLRAAAFVFHEHHHRRRDPARTLAEGVVAQVERAARLPPQPLAPPPRLGRPPPDPLEADAWATAARLRQALVEEVAQAPAEPPDPSEPQASSTAGSDARASATGPGPSRRPPPSDPAARDATVAAAIRRLPPEQRCLLGLPAADPRRRALIDRLSRHLARGATGPP